ncbi:hypothetical protein FB45DRAFT_1068183 [Roridomyces roridus]|uniref:Uncharacterized protein n=1 Tax=Roridomyces roridus TaxID=1738132 RepID=A0AAD7B0Y8_9AGAR|nr:hypothetical protein FB45DRAFT_1068183 [Roridomyces roridus]
MLTTGHSHPYYTLRDSLPAQASTVNRLRSCIGTHLPVVMVQDYLNGVAPIITTFGPGNLHHLAYAPQISSMININGVVPISNQGATNFVLGFSYYYEGFAFYWDGAGEASFRLGNSTETLAVGIAGPTQLAAVAQNRPAPATVLVYQIPEDLD